MDPLSWNCSSPEKRGSFPFCIVLDPAGLYYLRMLQHLPWNFLGTRSQVNRGERKRGKKVGESRGFSDSLSIMSFSLTSELEVFSWSSVCTLVPTIWLAGWYWESPVTLEFCSSFLIHLLLFTFQSPELTSSHTISCFIGVFSGRVRVEYAYFILMELEPSLIPKINF